jgi:exopolyphosphatase/pppGpp-phosphohydrolase
MHDVGKSRRQQNHQKKSYRMIRKMERPLGWSAREAEIAAVVARYHRGVLPHSRDKAMQALGFPDRRTALELAGVLRLANALDTRPRRQGTDGEKAPAVQVILQDSLVVLRVGRYSASDRSAEDVAAARHLLETVLRYPIVVRTLRATPLPTDRQKRPAAARSQQR